MRFTSSIFVFASTVALLHCGGDAAGTGGGTTTDSTTNTASTTTSATTSTTGTSTAGAADVAKFCDAVTAPLCESLFACCQDPMKLAQQGGSVEACKTKFATDCANDVGGSLAAAIDAGATVLDEARLATCVAELNLMSAGGAACVRPPWFVLLFDCVSAFRGTIADGASCAGFDLHDTAFVLCQSGDCDGEVCQPFLAEGAACDPSYPQQCDFTHGQGCVGAPGATKCGPLPDVGAACPDAGFDKTGTCKSMSCGPNGTCVPPTANGICSQG